MNTTEKVVLDRFKALLSKRVRVYRIILFGSRARGDADPQSDMDVAVILDGAADDQARDAVSDCAWEAGFDQAIVVVPVVFGREEWENGPERYSLLAQAVQAEGLEV